MDQKNRILLRILIGFALLLFLVDGLAFYWYVEFIPQRLITVFLVSTEQSISNWWSSSLALLIGLCFLFRALKESGSERASLSEIIFNRTSLYFFFSFAFLFLSLDDAIKLHERIGSQTFEFFGGSRTEPTDSFIDTFPTYTWHLVYFPFLALGSFALLCLCWLENGKKWYASFTFVGLCFLLLAVGVDFVEGIPKYSQTIDWFDIVSYENPRMRHLSKLFEETLELCGLSCLLVGASQPFLGDILGRG